MKKKSVVESLTDQLIQMGADSDCFIDLVNDYMGLWEIKNDLLKDIKKRGVVYTDVSSVGVPMQKNNPSVKELVNVNRQMVSILDRLNITTDKCVPPTGDDECDL